MSHPFWRPTGEQRRAILYLEVVGLLHDLGKLSNGFLKHTAHPQFSYNYRFIADPLAVIPTAVGAIRGRFGSMLQGVADPASGAPFKDRSDLTGIFQSHSLRAWDGQQYSLAELLLGRFATQALETITGKSFQPAVLIGYLHGIAHYEKEAPDSTNKQPYTNTYSSSPFGDETHIPVDSAGSDLTSELQQLALSDIPKVHTPERLQWLADLRGCLVRGVADTQRPTNEVSLWDWGYAVATMAKAAAAYIFKNGWPSDQRDLPFSTLRINLDALELYTHSDKISDLLGVSDALDRGFRGVQTLLEETYAFGNRFYYDETGAYYLLPNIFDEGELAALRGEIQALFPPDLLPQVQMSGPITAGEIDGDKSQSKRLVAEPRNRALNDLRGAPVVADNNLYTFETEWSADRRPENAEACTVCGVRPVGYPRRHSEPEVEDRLEAWAKQDKSEERNICRICLNRRGRRAQKWATSELGGTIWTDEVADANGRLALFVGRLGLENWLDGELLKTIRVKDGKTKNPSPARLYRIAETARAFWRETRDELMPGAVGLRPFRLALYPGDQPELGDYHVYELEVNGVGLSVVWDRPNGRFLTADNLVYFGRRCDMKQGEVDGRVEGHTFSVKESSAFMQPGAPLATVTVRRTERLGGYLPAIPILAEPSVCLMLVPADKALDLVRAMKLKYEGEMGRVRDRLPLHAGLIFCHRRTPIRAVLEAGRAMLKMSPTEWEGWGLKENSSLAVAERVMTFENGITWNVPVVAGDGTTKDGWYPRMYQGDVRTCARLRHVNELEACDPNLPPQEGPKVWVRPSRFDFEFLDTTGRRFEIYYGEFGRRPRPSRPFFLEDVDHFDELWRLMKRLAVSQRHRVINTIEATREEWYGAGQHDQAKGDGVFRQFVADTLAGASWPSGQPWKHIPQELRDGLIRAGVGGELTDLAELHLEILKER